MESLRTRPGGPADAAGVAAVARAAWPATYRGLLGEERIAHAVEVGHAEERLREQLADPAATWFVAERDEETVGYLHLLRHADGTLELLRLYVRPDLLGRGTGSLLLAALEAHLPPGSAFTAQVHPRNERALRFYAARGFSEEARAAHASGCDVRLRRVTPG